MFKNFGTYAISRTINAVIAFMLTPIFTVLFTKSDFGKIGIISISFPVISIVIGLGLSMSYSLKFYQVTIEERINLRKNITVFSFAIYIVVMISTYLLYTVLEQQLNLGLTQLSYLKIISIGYFMFLIPFFLEYYKMNEESIKYSVLQVSNSLFVLLVTLYFVYFVETSIEWYINGYFYANLLFIIVIMIYERFSTEDHKFRFFIDTKLIYRCIILGVPIAIGMIFSFGLNYADRYILKDITNSFALVGSYTLGYKLGEVFSGFILSPFLMAATPTLFRTFNEDVIEFKRMINLFLRYLLGLSMIYLLFMNVGINLIFHFLFKDYVESQTIIEIVSISFIIYGCGQLIGSIIIVNEKIKVTVFFSVLASIVNISLNYITIPLYGMNGAALSTLLSYLIVFLCFIVYSKKLMTIQLYVISHIKFIAYSCLFIFLVKIVKLESVWIELVLRALIGFIYLFILYKSKYFFEINEFIGRRKKYGTV